MCENCASALDKSEADHISPLRDLVAGQDHICRLLCPTCHGEVSEPAQRRSVNPIISQFNPATYEAFVRSPRPVQCVAKLNVIDPKREIAYIDVRRCRRSCLVNATEPWPVFCAHDEVSEVSAHIGPTIAEVGNIFHDLGPTIYPVAYLLTRNLPELVVRSEDGPHLCRLH